MPWNDIGQNNMNNKPKVLYKYKSINLSAISKIIEIYFSEPKNFNDPYDCIYHLINKSPNLNEKAKIVLNNIQSCGILSLTSKPVNMLMWSHYADQHRGVCVGYNDKARFFDEFTHPGGLQKITYIKENENNTKNRVIKNINKLITSSLECSEEKERRRILIEVIKLLFAQKSDHWSYEDEWRIVWYLADIKGPIQQNHYLPKEKRIVGIKPDKEIDCIIFGARMSDEIRNIIYHALNRKYGNITFKEAYFTDVLYQIKIKAFISA